MTAQHNPARPIDMAFAIPGDIDAPTGGYAYARHLIRALPACGITPHHIELPGSFPHPTDDDLARTRHLLDQIHPSTPVLFDGLAFGALPEGFLAGLKMPIIALVHHPLALETGVTPERRDALLASERASLKVASAVITTSPYTTRILTADYGVATRDLTAALPGTAPAARATGTGTPFTILTVGAVIPRKGYGYLVDALAMLDATTDAPAEWHLDIVGSLAHAPAEVTRLREHIMSRGLRGRIRLTGSLPTDELDRLWSRADLFVLSSLYEGYGMALAEALAHGLPIVTTTGGAAGETAPDSAALKVPPGDAARLSEAIATVRNDRARHAAMADAAWQAGRALPTWDDTAARIADVIHRVKREQTS